ncbi:hypothetical protein ACWF0M_01500 [Kribbella sp. NPDC055110]
MFQVPDAGQEEARHGGEPTDEVGARLCDGGEAGDVCLVEDLRRCSQPA